MEGVIALVRKIRYFKGSCHSRSKFHVSLGHNTVMATATFFGASELASILPPSAGSAASDGIVSYRSAPVTEFPWGASEFAWQDELYMTTGPTGKDVGDAAAAAASAGPKSDWQWAVLLFDSPTLCSPDGLLIGSKLDTDLHAKTCRLAFYGNVVAPIDNIPAK